MPITWQNAILIGSGVVRNFRGWSVGCNSQPVPVAVWPARNSALAVAAKTTGDSQVGAMAINVAIFPINDCYFAIDAIPNTIGPNSAMLVSKTEYIFNLHPSVQTLFFLDAVSATGPVYVRFVVP